MKKWLLLPVLLIVLAGCTDDTKDEKSAKTEEDSNVGFEMTGENVEEAANIPEDEKGKILAAFDEYINSFNEEDIDRYKNTLSLNPEGFDYEEDIKEAKNAFEQYDIKRTPSDVTIVKFNDKEAQVFSTIVTDMKETATKVELSQSGRQVTVFVKEDDNWKVSSIFYIGDPTNE